MNFYSVNIQMKANEQCFPLVMFIIHVLYKLILTFEAVDELPKCNHSINNVSHKWRLGAQSPTHPGLKTT